MHQPPAFDPTFGVSDVYFKPLRELYELIRLRTTVRILIVVDGGISLTEQPAGFGVGRVIRLLRESRVNCTSFLVDLARREGAQATNASPGPSDPRYTGFRFDQQENGAPILHKYDEVWCFGFNPDNFAQSDANITLPSALPTSDAELEVLARWMNERRGGVLAMGDHDYLGASMCHRIPRIRSMRRWTNAQGVPPIGGAANPDTALRHDTNQPLTFGEINNGDSIDFEHQSDEKPQPLEWVAWMSAIIGVFRVQKRPHPVLCHPTLGPINVMPDHPHEGWCFENDEIDLTAPYQFGALSGDEYPTVGGNQPAPMIIAYGTTTPNPPFNLDKGPSPRKRFGMISVYDGHPADVGRVATDSTWHHWFDINITTIEAAGGPNWEKISRYYLNVASWLAPPGFWNWCLLFDVLQTHFSYLGFQEYSPKANIFDVGRVLYVHLHRHRGPCWVTQWVLDEIYVVDRKLWAWLKERLFWRDGIPIPRPNPCLTCPPFELLEVAILGGLVKSTAIIAEEIKAQVRDPRGKGHKLDPERLLRAQREGVAMGLKEFRAALDYSAKEMRGMME